MGVYNLKQFLQLNLSMECESNLFIEKSSLLEPKQKCCDATMSNVFMEARCKRVTVHLIILCGIKNFVGIIQIMRIVCKSGYNFFI
jgi:hypothetical protein